MFIHICIYTYIYIYIYLLIFYLCIHIGAPSVLRAVRDENAKNVQKMVKDAKKAGDVLPHVMKCDRLQ